jgi:hypothetical protein
LEGSQALVRTELVEGRLALVGAILLYLSEPLASRLASRLALVSRFS